MKPLVEKIKDLGFKAQIKLQTAFKTTVQNERGDIGIKQLAITVGVIVIVGAAVVALKDQVGTILTTVWDWLFEVIQDMVG